MREARKSLSEKLITAVAAGDVASMRVLLAQRADVNCTDAQGFTPLMMAAYHWKVKGDFKDGVQLLLDAGAQVDVVNMNSQSALMIASIYGLSGMAEMLLAHGADMARKDCTGMTATDMAVQNGHDAVVELLQKEYALRAGAARKVKRVEDYLKSRARHCKKSKFKP